MRLAIGMVELNSIARGIETCDYMVKAAQIQLLRSSTVCPGKYLILIGGETGDVSEGYISAKDTIEYDRDHTYYNQSYCTDKYNVI